MKRTAVEIKILLNAISCTWTQAADLKPEDSKHSISRSIKDTAERKSVCRVRVSYLISNSYLTCSKKKK